MAALALRLRGLDFLLPHHSEPDAQVVTLAERLRDGSESHDYVWSTYPHLLARALSVWPLTPPPTQTADLQAALAAAAEPFLHARLLSALLGALAIPLTYAVARHFAARPIALGAAALLATSLLHVNFSQQARPHVPFATFALAVVWCGLRLRERASFGRTLVFAVALHVAIGTLHFALFLLPVGPLALLLRRERERRLHAYHVLLPLLGGLAAAWLYWPFLFEAAPQAAWSEGLSHRFPHALESTWASGGGFLRYPQLLWWNEPVLAVLALLGLARLLRGADRAQAWERRRELAVVLAFVVPLAAALGIFEQTYTRFLVSLLPFLALAAALGGAAVLEAAAARTRAAARPALGVGLALALLAFPSYACWRLGTLRARPDTLETAAAALLRIPQERPLRIALHPSLVLPLPLRPTESLAQFVRADAEPNAWLGHLLCTSVSGSADYECVQVDRDGRFPLPVHATTERDGRALCDQLVELDPEVLVVPPMDSEQRFEVLAQVLTGAVRPTREPVASFGARRRRTPEGEPGSDRDRRPDRERGRDREHADEHEHDHEHKRERPQGRDHEPHAGRAPIISDAAFGFHGPKDPRAIPAVSGGPREVQAEMPESTDLDGRALVAPSRAYPSRKVRRFAVPPNPPQLAPVLSRSYQDDQFLRCVLESEIWGPPVWLHYFPESFSGFLAHSR
jgi:hypothetical protein